MPRILANPTHLGEERWRRELLISRSAEIPDRMRDCDADPKDETAERINALFAEVDYNLRGNGREGIIGPSGEKRRKPEDLCTTKIMAVDEYCDYVTALRANRRWRG